MIETIFHFMPQILLYSYTLAISIGIVIAFISVKKSSAASLSQKASVADTLCNIMKNEYNALFSPIKVNEGGGMNMTEMCVAAANYFVRLTNEYNANIVNRILHKKKIKMSCKRLMKLLYFADIDYMKATSGKSMFTDPYLAMPNGPVLMGVYCKFIGNPKGDFKEYGEEDCLGKLDTEQQKIIKKVFKRTKRDSTEDLIAYSHIKDEPWDKVFDKNNSDALPCIYRFYIYSFYIDRDWRHK